MKKPFILLRGGADKAKLFLSFALLLGALSLFFAPDEAATVFADGSMTAGKSLYGLLGRLICS